MHRRALLAGLAVAPLAAPAARAQAFPDRPLRYIVPFPPAGLTDIFARLLGQKLSNVLGRPVVVENRAGGNAMIGADAVAKSPPDGHTWLALTSTHTVNPALFPHAPYDFQRDLRVVSVLGSLPLVVVVRPESPWRTLAELAAAAREKPLNGGSSPNGSPPHLGLELFRQATGAGQRLVHVPYRGGAPSLTDLIAGNLDLIVSNLPECLGHIQAGRLRGLAVTDTTRHPLIPDIPTTTEAGMPALKISNWTGIAVPRATPEPIVAALWAAIQRALADAELRGKITGAGFAILALPPSETEDFVRQEVARWARLVAEANIKAE